MTSVFGVLGDFNISPLGLGAWAWGDRNVNWEFVTLS